MFGRKKKSGDEGAVRLQNPLMVAFFDEEGALTVRIDPDQVPSGMAAGMILADYARHFRNMLVDAGKEQSHESALSEIERGFRHELDDPTDDPHGKIES